MRDLKKRQQLKAELRAKQRSMAASAQAEVLKE
jgi:hypothetical protein